MILLSTFWDVFWGVFVALLIILPLIMLWVFALVDLFLRRDIAWRKVLWLLVIILFPVFGSIIYLLVRPREDDLPPAPAA